MASILPAVLILGIIFAVAIGLHASSNNKSGIFWGGVTLFTGIFGVLFYAISLASDSSNPQNTWECSSCEANNTESANYCENCGEKLEEGQQKFEEENKNPEKRQSGDIYHCSLCGIAVDETAAECPSCGRQFENNR